MENLPPPPALALIRQYREANNIDQAIINYTRYLQDIIGRNYNNDQRVRAVETAAAIRDRWRQGANINIWDAEVFPADIQGYNENIIADADADADAAGAGAPPPQPPVGGGGGGRKRRNHKTQHKRRGGRKRRNHKTQHKRRGGRKRRNRKTQHKRRGGRKRRNRKTQHKK
jgi:hypothetical protein